MGARGGGCAGGGPPPPSCPPRLSPSHRTQSACARGCAWGGDQIPLRPHALNTLGVRSGQGPRVAQGPARRAALLLLYLTGCPQRGSLASGGDRVQPLTEGNASQCGHVWGACLDGARLRFRRRRPVCRTRGVRTVCICTRVPVCDASFVTCDRFGFIILSSLQFTFSWFIRRFANPAGTQPLPPGGKPHGPPMTYFPGRDQCQGPL